MRSLTDFIDRFKADTKKSNLFFVFGRLTDGEDTHNVSGVKGNPIVPDQDLLRFDIDVPLCGFGVFGVLQQFDKEVAILDARTTIR